MKAVLRGDEPIIRVDPAHILPNPAQPRRVFDPGELDGLADSIRRFGVLQPLVIRKNGTGYELIAGERRLRASILAGLDAVPCRVMETDDDGSAEIAVTENLQRCDLNLFEEAEALSRLMETGHLTQEDLAQRLSVSQSYVANKCRLLRLTPEEREAVLRAGLSERHCRALIKLDGAARTSALKTVIARGYNVAATERYIADLLARGTEKPHRRGRIKGALGDLRLFYNSIDHALGIMRGAGLKTKCRKTETPEGVEMTILISRPAP